MTKSFFFLCVLLFAFTDGDGKLDITVYRPSEGKWYVLTASQAILSQTFGLNGDLPTENAFVY